MDTKSWSFIIQQYKSLIQKFKTKKDFSIEKDLSEKEINNIQVVIIDQDNFFIYVQFPQNDVPKKIVIILKAAGTQANLAGLDLKNKLKNSKNN